jgi:adenylate kinase family enzyme
MNSHNGNAQKLPDVKKVLGNPKITFVLGGPASGKGTQCAKLVEEFGYTHISTGDLFRAEVAKGSREGAMMKRIMNEGGLIPYQLTVQVLINSLIANPSKNYLIDGFPRARDQAVYFEQVVGEAQSVLYFNTPLDVCVARCMERAKTSGRSDDTEETIKARLRTYEEQSKPVVEMYAKFGKVREVDGSHDTMTVWRATREAMLPQVSWIVGPKISGKTSIGNALGQRTNSKLINFNDFIKSHGLEHSDDDTVVLALIQ